MLLKQHLLHLLHGEQDAVVSAAQSRDAAHRLRELGATVSVEFFAGLGHGIDARVAQRVVALLQAAPV